MSTSTHCICYIMIGRFGGKPAHIIWARFCTVKCRALVSNYQLPDIRSVLGFKLLTSEGRVCYPLHHRAPHNSKWKSSEMCKNAWDVTWRPPFSLKLRSKKITRKKVPCLGLYTQAPKFKVPGQLLESFEEKISVTGWGVWNLYFLYSNCRDIITYKSKVK